MCHESPFSRAFWRGGIDPRPVALFRIGYAAILLLDWLDRLRDFHTFYTDGGVVPRPAVAPGSLLRLFHLVGSPAGVGTLWVIAIGASLALLVGWHTRLAAVASWMLVGSVQARNPLILDGADIALRAFGFWLLFIDAGACFSFDTWLGRRVRLDRIPAGPVRVVQLQVAIIYLFAAAAKTGASWRDGSAVFFALSCDLARPLGSLLIHASHLCRLATWFTLALEWAFPVAVFAGRRARAAALIGSTALHLAIYASLRVGWFPATMLTANLLFLLPSWLDGGLARLRGCGLRFATRTGETDFERLGHSAAKLRRSPRREAVSLAFLLILFGALTVSLVAPGQFAGGQKVLRALGLNQSWNMFAPDPPRLTTRWEARGTLIDGAKVSLLPEAAPQLVATDSFSFSRWYKLRTSLLLYGSRNLTWVAAFLCRRWNTDHPHRQLAEFELVLHGQGILLPGMRPVEATDVEKIQPLLHQSCR